MKINIALCDDENITLRIYCTYIEELAKKYRVDINIAGFIRSENLMDYVERATIDIAFLDIDLKGVSGITVATKILKKNPRTIIIFITSHREYAFDAFNLEAFGYLTKPIDPERLERIFKKAILQVNYINNKIQSMPLVITENNIKKKINQSAILYIERKNTQSVIVMKTGRHCVYEAISSMAERMEDNFLQINQSIIVNMEEIESLEGTRVKMKTGEIFAVGRTFGKEVKRRYLEYPQV